MFDAPLSELEDRLGQLKALYDEQPELLETAVRAPCVYGASYERRENGAVVTIDGVALTFAHGRVSAAGTTLMWQGDVANRLLRAYRETVTAAEPDDEPPDIDEPAPVNFAALLVGLAALSALVVAVLHGSGTPPF